MAQWGYYCLEFGAVANPLNEVQRMHGNKRKSPFPIIHNHGRNAHSAESHCFSLILGGWAAKLKHVPVEGWQVIVTGFRGVQNASAV